MFEAVKIGVELLIHNFIIQTKMIIAFLVRKSVGNRIAQDHQT